MTTRHEINEVANRLGIRVDGLSDQVAKMVVLGTVLPGGLPLEQQTEARVDSAFTKVAAAQAIQQRRDACEANRVLRIDGLEDAASAQLRARQDALEAWRQPLRSALTVYDTSDRQPADPDADLEQLAHRDAEGRFDDAATARSKMLRAHERAWQAPLSAGIRAP